MSVNRRIISLTIVILLLQFCYGCHRKMPDFQSAFPSQDEKVYVNPGGIWGSYKMGDDLTLNNIPTPIHNRSECIYQDILNILQSDSIALAPASLEHWQPFEFEVVTVISKDLYEQKISDGSTADIPVIVLFAYEYDTKKVYVIVDDQVYSVGNSENLRQLLFPYLNYSYEDTKITWANDKDSEKHAISECPGSYYYHFYSFRYDRFWCNKRELPDNFFVEISGYSPETIDQIEDALRLLSLSLGYGQFSAYIGDDEKTGYWYIEMYESDSLNSVKVFLNENYQILYGSMYGASAEVGIPRG